jgi:cellulose synthase/poly-beta-1,6-N-acetylglucosamine synthase-like glycosyltransferase
MNISEHGPGILEPSISVIIPCYNEARYIRRCLATLIEQSLPAREIIVVDDGSSDQTVEIVKEFNVHLLRQNHAGPAAARNLGAGAASGEILVLVDADMFFDRDYLLRLTAPIAAGNAMGTFTKDEFVGNPENIWATCWNLETVGSRDRRVPADSPDECDAFRAIRRQSFMNVRGYETTIGYEDDASLAPKLGFTAKPAPGAVCYHNNPSSLQEVYHSARWIGRGSRLSGRPRKMLRYVPPLSFVFALARGQEYGDLRFVVFKLVYDAGILTGILSRLLFRTHAK